jgi:hypothetical protein
MSLVPCESCLTDDYVRKVIGHLQEDYEVVLTKYSKHKKNIPDS